MKVLVYCWGSNSEDSLISALKKRGYIVSVCVKECKNYIKDMELAWEIIQIIQREQIDVVMSYNYFPIISSICETAKKRYYSLVYDCPHYTLFTHQALLECNYFWIFDKELCERLLKYGVKHVGNTILPVDVNSFSEIIEKTARKDAFCADVSFVGSLYTGNLNYYESIQKKADLDLSICESFVQKNLFCYGESYLKDLDEFSEKNKDYLFKIGEKAGILLGEDFYVAPSEPVISRILETKITVEERRLLLEEVARQGWDFKLYTNSDVSQNNREIQRANRGTVDYGKEMPLVFHYSKINLNCSLKSIHTGIPLRVLDIMACGGFVLTNEQAEMREYFEIGKDLVTFVNPADCIEKIQYYLKNEEERKAIARNGYEKVKKLCVYDDLIDRIHV